MVEQEAGEEHRSDVISIVKRTEAWEAWGQRYKRSLRGQGKKPFKVAEAQLKAIPPDTYSSLMHDLRTGNDTVPFSKIAEELSQEQIKAVLEHQSAFSDVAVMQFSKSRNPNRDSTPTG